MYFKNAAKNNAMRLVSRVGERVRSAAKRRRFEPRPMLSLYLSFCRYFVFLNELLKKKCETAEDHEANGENAVRVESFSFFFFSHCGCSCLARGE